MVWPRSELLSQSISQNERPLSRTHALTITPQIQAFNHAGFRSSRSHTHSWAHSLTPTHTYLPTYLPASFIHPFVHPFIRSFPNGHTHTHTEAHTRTLNALPNELSPTQSLPLRRTESSQATTPPSPAFPPSPDASAGWERVNR